jgi:hypothetical protein
MTKVCFRLHNGKYKPALYKTSQPFHNHGGGLDLAGAPRKIRNRGTRLPSLSLQHKPFPGRNIGVASLPLPRLVSYLQAE